MRWGVLYLLFLVQVITQTLYQISSDSSTAPPSSINVLYWAYMLAPQTRIILVRSTELITGALIVVAALGISTNFYLLDLGISIGFFVLAALSFLMGYRLPGAGAIVLALVFNPFISLHLPRHIWVVIDILA